MKNSKRIYRTIRTYTPRTLPREESFQDLYALIQVDKKVAQSFDIKAFDHINKIEKAVKNYENSLYNREHSSSPKVALEHTQLQERN